MGLAPQLSGKKPRAKARDVGSIPGLGRSTREGNGNPLQYSCLENSMDRGAWQAAVHGVTKSGTRQTDQQQDTTSRSSWQTLGQAS